MQRLNNSEIPKMWINGIAARSNNGQFSTDGKTLFSYNLPIGRTIDTKQMIKKVFCEYNSKSDNFVSSTTSQHVGLTLRHIARGYSIESGFITTTADSTWFKSLK